MACRDTLLASNGDELAEFKNYFMRTFSPVPSNAQDCESSKKDTVRVDETGRKEDAT